MILTACAYALYGLKGKVSEGVKIPSCPTICCIRRRVLSLSVSANFTTRLEEAPYAQREGTEETGREREHSSEGGGRQERQRRRRRGRGGAGWKCPR